MKINRIYYLYGYTTKLVTKILQRCSTCQTYSNKTIKPPIYSNISLKVNERWIMDYTQFESNFWVLVIIDCFSRRVWAQAFSNKKEINVINKLKEIFKQFGKPTIIQSDNGGVSFKYFLY
jgi:transposase InsO family protein